MSGAAAHGSPVRSANGAGGDASALRCEACRVALEGEWSVCPLCAGPVAGRGVSPSPFSDPPLAYSRRRVLQVLFLVSLALIGGSFAAQLFFRPQIDGIGPLRSVWLGIAAMWLVVLMAVRRRRTIARGIFYLMVITSAVCVYWDYLTGWHGWALAYAVPIVFSCAILGVVLLALLFRADRGAHVVFSWITVLLGLLPVAFFAFGWTVQAIPSVICGAIAVIAVVLLQVLRGQELHHELERTIHV